MCVAEVCTQADKQSFVVIIVIVSSRKSKSEYSVAMADAQMASIVPAPKLEFFATIEFSELP